MGSDFSRHRSVRVSFKFLQPCWRVFCLSATLCIPCKKMNDTQASNSILQCKFPPFGAKSVHPSVNLPIGPPWPPDMACVQQVNLARQVSHGPGKAEVWVHQLLSHCQHPAWFEDASESLKMLTFRSSFITYPSHATKAGVQRASRPLYSHSMPLFKW
jgi:hypothetical protein